VNENFNFYNKHLAGTKELRARWKRCSELVDNHLGEALGIAYVEKTFGKDAKTRMLELVNNLYKALEKDINSDLPWMMPATKKEALTKLTAIANKIGYPEKWRDYSSVKIVRGDALGNAGRAATFEFQRQLNKIGKPVDKTEWGMTPPTVNAYYNPLENNINFPAGILQPPFFYKDMDDPVNYGGIGVVIGHEITHGFDDQGRQFDAQGNMRDWWTPEDNKRFDERAACFVEQYGNYQATPDLKLNGKLTLGENAADNGGMRISWMALMDVLTKDPKKKKTKIDGFTPEQRFFLGFAQVWCENRTEQSSRLQAQSDPHSPGRYRANGTISNMPEFQKAFSCKAGQPMAPEKRCRVW
jgi:putative endopeptidase